MLVPFIVTHFLNVSIFLMFVRNTLQYHQSKMYLIVWMIAALLLLGKKLTFTINYNAVI